MRNLIETVAGGLRTEPDRLEQGIETGIARHGRLHFERTFKMGQCEAGVKPGRSKPAAGPEEIFESKDLHPIYVGLFPQRVQPGLHERGDLLADRAEGVLMA
jgi:hypothetical protein